MRLVPAVLFAAIFFGAILLSGRLWMKQKVYFAQFPALVAIGALFVYVLLWATLSSVVRDPALEISRDFKVGMLGVSGGLGAQLIIWTNRISSGPESNTRVAPIYLDAFLGVVCGLALVALVSLRFANFGDMSDQTAGCSGIIGGAMGVNIVTIARKFGIKSLPELLSTWFPKG